MEQFRKSHITLPLPGSPAAANQVATFIAGHPMRLNSAQLSLSDTGTGAGATSVRLNVNGVAVTAADISVAQGAAVRATKSVLAGTPAAFPGGVRLNAGDVVTVDVTAVPATTSPKAACVILSAVQLDA